MIEINKINENSVTPQCTRLYTHLSMHTQEADFACVDNLSDRVRAGAVEVLLKISRLYELACRRVHLKGLTGNEVVVAAAHLIITTVSCGVCDRYNMLTYCNWFSYLK